MGAGYPTQAKHDHGSCTGIGNDTTLNVAGASGNFELNVFMPVMHKLLHYSTLGDACNSLMSMRRWHQANRLKK